MVFINKTGGGSNPQTALQFLLILKYFWQLALLSFVIIDGKISYTYWEPRGSPENYVIKMIKNDYTEIESENLSLTYPL